MEIKPGDTISVRHYSGISPFKSIVVEADTENLTVKLTKDFAVMNFLEGDPVVFGYEAGEQVHIIGCNISSINARQGTIKLEIDKVETGSEKRQYERYPVSLYSDVRVKGERKKQLGTIKDMSYYGMRMYSKAEFSVHQILEIDIYMDKAMIFLKANVMRKTQCPHYFEYGLGILYEDTSSLNYMKEYIRRIQLEQEEAIRKLKNSK